MEPAGPPRAPVAVPSAVARVADRSTGGTAGRSPLRAVWRNNLGGLTFEAAGPPRRFVKWAPADSGLDLAAEATRMRWAAQWTTVPQVVEHGTDDDGSWLVTEALPGRSAVDPRWLAHPASAVRAVGVGLRALHDALPLGECPFDWSVAERVARAGSHGIDVPADLRAAPPIDVLVVCHGDACAPNTLLADDGTVVGHVDLGTLGVADRWADLAAASLSTGWNYGPGWDDLLLDAYGVARDDLRLDYYRRLWLAT